MSSADHLPQVCTLCSCNGNATHQKKLPHIDCLQLFYHQGYTGKPILTCAGSSVAKKALERAKSQVGASTGSFQPRAVDDPHTILCLRLKLSERTGQGREGPCLCEAVEAI